MSEMQPDEYIVSQAERRRFSSVQVLGIVLGAICITVLCLYLLFKFVLFPDHFRPVELSQKEEKILADKLTKIGLSEYADDASIANSNVLEPEAYSELNADRDVSFTEREINALLAKNTDLADKLAIDLSENLLSAKLIVPLDPDFPMFGGQTLKIKAGLSVSYQESRPSLVLKGVSVMGVPVPSAWLGGYKNRDFIGELGNGEGFWQAFADGLDHIQVEDGRLDIRFKE